MSKLHDLESFAMYIEAATRQAGFAIAKREGADLYVLLHGQPLRCNLNKIYQVYHSSPHLLDDIVQVHLNALRQTPQSLPAPTEKEAAESLLPVLNQAQWLKRAHRKDVVPLAYRPFVAGLVVTYVFDFPNYRAYVNEDMLVKMVDHPETTFDMIHEYALENLRRRTTSQSYKTHGLHDKTMITCETGDGYAATRILLPDLMARWAERIPGQMLIGIPNRDFLIAFSNRNPKRVATLARQVRRDARRHDHPLCADLLVWQNGQVRAYRSKN